MATSRSPRSARGRLTDIDTAAAEKAPGVILVLTHKNMPPQSPNTDGAAPQLADDRILFRGQPIALVVAETFEQARAASRLVQPTYAAEPGAHDLAAAQPKAEVPKPRNGTPPDTHKGDAEAAFAAAPVKIDVTYRTPTQSHAMMEPHATLAVWDGDRLTLFSANQNVTRGAAVVAKTLQCRPRRCGWSAASSAAGSEPSWRRRRTRCWRPRRRGCWTGR